MIMADKKKNVVLVRGRIVKMNDAAFKIASKYFGATKNKLEEPEIPFELHKLPKLEIVSALKEVKPTEVKAEEVKAVEVVPEEVKTEVKTRKTRKKE